MIIEVALRHPNGTSLPVGFYVSVDDEGRLVLNEQAWRAATFSPEDARNKKWELGKMFGRDYAFRLRGPD